MPQRTFDSYSLWRVTTSYHAHTNTQYVVGDNDAAFVGDTVFMPDSGSARCDFPGGSAEELWASVRRLLDDELVPSTRIFVCHDYGAGGTREPAWETTVAETKASNKHLKDGVSREDFLKMRKERDATLSYPRLLFPALQANIVAGRLPEPDADGVRRMRIPLNFDLADLTGAPRFG